VSPHDPESDSPKSSTNAVEHYSGTLHEVSNALTVVLGWLDMAGRAPTLEEAREALRVAHEHARRGQAMARRGIGAEVAQDHQRRMASELVEFAATSVSPQAARGAIEVVTEIEDGTEVRVEADASVLQILTNLLLNAVDFTPPGAKVCVSVRRAEQGLSLQVADEGPGIARERMSELFTAAVSTRPGGAGIGLPYSRALARNHGGDLRIVAPSERPGAVGACFELQWPYARSSAISSGPPESVRVALRGARVLLIEDDLAISSLIDLTLDAYGAQVLSLTTEEEVQNTLQGAPVFDAALVDLSPLKDTLIPSLERLKMLSPRAPLILMSGEPAGVPEEAQGYFDSWVRKPFDMDQLLRTLSELLQEAQ
jgi:CheY-like chemotaxis protein/two-component sensor histidine kinase